MSDLTIGLRIAKAIADYLERHGLAVMTVEHRDRLLARIEELERAVETERREVLRQGLLRARDDHYRRRRGL